MDAAFPAAVSIAVLLNHRRKGELIVTTAALSASAALLLVISGAAKLRAPGPTAEAIAALRVPAARMLARRGIAYAIGAGEIAVAGYALLIGNRTSDALLALAYVAFLAVALRLRSVSSGTSCGCFGASRAPVSVAHIVVCSVAAVVAAVAAARASGPLWPMVSASPVVGTVSLGFCGLLVAVTYLAMTRLPELAGVTGRRG